MGKKGVSTVVVSILLVLVAIMAVVIIWQILKPAIKKSTEQTDIALFTVNLKIIKAEILDDVQMKIIIKRGVGKGNLSKIRVILFNNNQDSQIYVANENLRELETKTFIFPLEIANPTKVEIYPVVNVKGKEKVGSLSDSRTFFSYGYKDLLIYYKFEGNAKDETGKNHGTIYGAEFVDSKEGFGKALSFDGIDDYVDSNIDLSWTAKDEFTMSAWIKTNIFNNKNPFIGKPDWEYYLTTTNDNKMLFIYWDTTGFQGLVIDSKTTLSADTWYHVAVTYNGSLASLYVNGRLEGTDVIEETLQDREENLTIGLGKTGERPPDYFNGIIDEVRIYNITLNEKQIKILYNI